MPKANIFVPRNKATGKADYSKATGTTISPPSTLKKSSSGGTSVVNKSNTAPNGNSIPSAYAPVPVPNYGDQFTDTSGNSGTAMYNPNTGKPLPRVTPNSNDLPSDGTIKSNIPPPLPASRPPSEDQVYADLLRQSSDIINTTKKGYDDQIKNTHGMAAASIASAGLQGSSVAPGIDARAVAPILQQRDQDLAQINDNIQKNAQLLYQANIDNYRDNRSDAIEAEKIAKEDATDNIKALAANHTDWNKYKKDNPKNYKALVDSLGGDPNVADAMFASSIPPANIVQSWVDGSKYNQLTLDPITGKPSIQSYDLGIKVPQSWTQDKISNNAVIYHGPNWDPSDPSTYQMFSIDPLTGLPTGQVGGDPNPDAPTDPDAITGAVTNVASAIGATDPKISLADAIDQYGIEEIVSGLVQNEGSSPVGVDNNPGNIKYKGLPGQIDSGVKATDGGTFASYKTETDGRRAIGSIVENAANGQSSSYGASPTLASFVNTYTGQMAPKIGDSPVGESHDILGAAGLDLPVFNYLTQGTASMSRMSAAQRNQIMTKANKWLGDHGIDVSTFQSRYKTYNDVLSSNIQRQQKTQIMEKELLGTTDNLLKIANDKELGQLNVNNVAKVWAGQQVNDPLATQYAFHFQQLKNELAGYYAASQGKASPDVIDNQDAAASLINGMSSGSLGGFRSAIENSTSKMKDVLDSSVNNANKAVWELFGVGSKFKPETPSASSEDVSGASDGSSGTLDNGTAVTKYNGQWHDATGNTYDDNGNPI